MSRRRVSSGYRKAAGGLLAGAVAVTLAYAVPPTAEGAASPVATPSGASPHHLSTRLTAYLAAGRAGLSAAATATEMALPATGAGSLLRSPDGSRLVVDVRLASRSAAALQGLRDAGATILSDDPGYGRVAVAVLPQDLSAVGDVDGVLYVGEELTPMVSAVCDVTKSEGDAILHADQLRAQGVDGTGVKVGVISDSYNTATGPATTAAQDIASDNLPGPTNGCGHTTASVIGAQRTPPDPQCGCTDEGRAMMQIVHDLAPGAALDFESAFISEPSFATSITKLADQGASVIVDDVTYFDEPMYQDGVVEQAVSGVRARGVDYFTDAANNRYTKGANEIGSYEAVNGYRPTTCPTLVVGYADCHNFGTGAAPDNTFSYTNFGSTNMRAVLDWAEPFNGVNTDFDILVINETTGAILSSATTVNAGVLGDQKSVELYFANQISVANRGLVVARRSAVAPAGAPRFKLILANNGLNPINTISNATPAPGTGDVMGPTTFGHNGGADAMSVGAASVLSSPTALESYSSYGPVTTLFAPVNGVSPAAPLASPRVVAKPDIVATDCNKNTFFGAGTPPRFCGTSSAAPHAAAVFALLRQKYPSASVAAINSAMVGTATPIAGVPASFQGGGLINALAAYNQLRPVPDTTITKAPKRIVRTRKKKTKVSFQFASSLPASTFTCSIDGKAFTACTSGVTYRLKVGRHTFAVRATAGGVTDPTPASVIFKIKKKRRHHRHHH